MWKNFILIYLILISPYWNSSQSEELCFFRMWWIWSWHPDTSDPGIWYQILILGIRCWSWVSDPDTAYQEEILHNYEEFFFFTIVKNFFSSDPDAGYQMLILGIRSWYWVSDPDTWYQILIRRIRMKFFTIMKNFFSSQL